MLPRFFSPGGGPVRGRRGGGGGEDGSAVGAITDSEGRGQRRRGTAQGPPPPPPLHEAPPPPPPTHPIASPTGGRLGRTATVEKLGTSRRKFEGWRGRRGELRAVGTAGALESRSRTATRIRERKEGRRSCRIFPLGGRNRE